MNDRSGSSRFKLGSLLQSIRAGVSLAGEARPLTDDDLGILTLAAVADGVFDPTKCKAVSAHLRSRLGPHASADTVLISRSNTEDLVGTCAYVERDVHNAFLPDLLWELRIHPDAPIRAKWLQVALSAEAGRRGLSRLASGTSGSMKKLSMARLRSIELLVPPLDMQDRTILVATALDESRRQVTGLRAAKRRFKRALLQQLLTGRRRFASFKDDDWRVATLASVVRVRSGNTPSKARADFWGGSVPWVSAKDLKSTRLDTSIDRITDLAVSNGAAMVAPGAVVILVRGMTLLKDVPVALVERRLAINQDIKALEPRTNVDSEFLLYALSARRGQLLGFVNRAGHGTGKLDTDRLLSLPIHLPSIEEQRRVAGILTALDHEMTLLGRQLAALRRLKHGLMQRLLTGELEVPTKKKRTTEVPA